MPSTPIPSQRSISQTFEILRASRGIGLVPFIPAGYPAISTTPVVLEALDSAGAAVIEVGFPFSDPVADGPTIQAAFSEALAKKLKVSQIFSAVASVSSRLSAPLVAMVSYSVVYRYGSEKFFADARSAGFSGLIIPDLPPPEAQRVCKLIRAAQLDTILLVSPTTTLERRREIAALCSGFVYYLSVSGITGERDELPASLFGGVAELRQVTDQPICVGFGIHKPGHIQSLRGVADGAIVGTAIVKKMTEAVGGGDTAIAAAVAKYCRELLGGNGMQPR